MSIAQRLTQGNSIPSEVTLGMLGTLDEVLEEATALAAAPVAPYVAYAFSAELRTGVWSDQHTSALLSFISGLRQQRSYLALRETADVLLNGEQVLDLGAAALHDALLPEAAIISSSPLLAGLQLDIALEVAARTTVPPYRLLALLTAPIHDYPEDFNDPLARAVGFAADVWTTPAERMRFAVTLAELAERGSEDAVYEGAVEQLRTALVQTNRTDLLYGVHQAKDRFDNLSRRGDGREDAAAFAQACTALIAFDELDKTTLSTSADAARTIADHRALLTRNMHGRHQTAARRAAQLAWVSLAWKLDVAAIEIEEDAFLDTWVAVDSIMKVYEADRQFTNLETVTTIIRPRITNEIAQRQAMAHQLRRAISIDKQRLQPELSPDIYELLELVNRTRAAQREPSDAPEEPSLRQSVFLQALLGPSSIVLNELGDADLARLEEAAEQTFVGSFAGAGPTNEIIDRLTANIIHELGENTSFVGMAKSDFSFLVRQTVRFLVYVGDNAQPYTRYISKGGTAPMEADIQKHFHQFLSASELAGRVGMEHSNIAGGRADVVTTLDGGRRYVTEIKRELTDASRQSLETSYLAQALEYQSTNEPLGQLLVLDLTDHSSGTPHVGESIWVTHRHDGAGRTVSSAVVAVVRGNRMSPSRMK